MGTQNEQTRRNIFHCQCAQFSTKYLERNTEWAYSRSVWVERKDRGHQQELHGLRQGNMHIGGD